MASRADIRAGRGSYGSASRSRVIDVVPDPVGEFCSWVMCGGTMCCALWFITTCVFAGLFGWAFNEWKNPSVDISSGCISICSNAGMIAYTNTDWTGQPDSTNWPTPAGTPPCMCTFETSGSNGFSTANNYGLPQNMQPCSELVSDSTNACF